MSGGVDSAVAAARAVEAGHDVVGVHLALSRQPGTLRTGARGCCTIEDSMDARRVADMLGIPFYVWDFSERFAADVVQDFVDEYREGRTPNPCMRCNQHIKFDAVMERGLALGFDAIATGHYAAVVEGEGGKELHRAATWAKDQSYVLGVLTAEQLEHCYFPLGATPSKDEVRQEAAARGFFVAQKPDSHDICFIPDGDTRGWLAERVGAQEGAVVDALVRWWEAIRVLTRSRSVSAKASSWGIRPTTASPGMSSRFAPKPMRWSWAPRKPWRFLSSPVRRCRSLAWIPLLRGTRRPLTKGAKSSTVTCRCGPTLTRFPLAPASARVNSLCGWRNRCWVLLPVKVP